MKMNLQKTFSGMTKILISGGLALASVNALANDALKSDMDQIGKIMRTLGSQAATPAQNASSATLAGQLIPLFTDALNQVPDEVAALPAAQQAGGIAAYKALIQQELNDATTLQTAFTNNDATTISNTLTDMNNAKATGHAQFNPPSPSN